MGSFLPLRFSRREHIEEDMRGLDETLSLLDEARGDGAEARRAALGRVLRARAHGVRGSHRAAPRDLARRRPLRASCSRAPTARRRAAAIAASRVSFHYHAGTYVETPREIERFIEGLDASLLGLCLRYRALGVRRRQPARAAARARRSRQPRAPQGRRHAAARAAARRGRGARARPGRRACSAGSDAGGADVDGCLAELRRRGYDGWLVVEQDQVLRADRTFEDAVASARANRAWLRERGL